MEIGQINWYKEPVESASVVRVEYAPVEIPGTVFDTISKVEMTLDHAKELVRSTPLLASADFETLVAQFLLNMHEEIRRAKIKRALDEQ